ncbi:MAG TPA: radical SAM protein [Streptosporangiaceae bacterium]
METGSLVASAGPTQPTARPTVEIPSIDWWITSRCQLACDFCYGPVPGRDPVGLRDEIVTALEKSSASVVTFCGGEPLLVRDVGKYARRLVNSGKRTVLNTNGLLLRRRADQGLDLAFSAVGLSIDGSTEAVHRGMRGAKADLGEVVHAAELVTSAPGMSLKLATVVSAVNRHDLPALATLVRGLNPHIWRLYQYSSRGEHNSGQQRHALPEAQFHSLAEMAARLAAPVPTAPSAEDLSAGCLIVDPAGNILQPDGSGYVSRGNCLDEPIDDIWARMTVDTIIENKRWLSVLAE